MKRVLWIFMAAVLISGAISAQVVQPKRTGALGNPEEPALRPYKWLWYGAKGLVYQTGHSFVRGNMKTPVVGSVDTSRGLGRGMVDLGESGYRGLTFAELPERDAYRQPARANAVMDEDMLGRNVRDAAFSWYAYPVVKAHDRWSIESEEEVSHRLEHAANIRDARREAGTKPQVVESDVYRAQQRYIGKRATYGIERRQTGTGNLLKLAK